MPPPTLDLSQSTLNQRLIWALVALIVIFVGLRFVNLDHDSPLFYSGYSTGEISDPYVYTSWARDRVLFGDWTPYDNDNWKSWRLSLVSGASWLVFSLAGVSRATANLTGIILQMSGALFFLLALARRRPLIEVLFAGLFLSVSSGFFFSSRLPFLESGLIFLSGLATYVYFRFGSHLAGLALSGILISLCVFAGKLTGIALIAPVIIDIFLNDRSSALKHLGFVAGGLVAGACVYSFVLYGESPLTMLALYRSQTSSVAFSPLIPETLWNWLQMFLMYGAENGLIRFHPALALLVAVGLFFALRQISSSRKKLKLPLSTERTLLFLTLWLVIGAITLAPYDYRPARYFMPLMLPASALAAYAIRQLVFPNEYDKASRKTHWFVMALVVLIVVYLTAQAFALPGQLGALQRRPTAPLDGGTLVVGLILGALVILSMRIRSFPRWLSLGSALAIALVVIVRQSALIYEGLVYPHDNLSVQISDLGEALGEGALLAGNFAPAFAIDNSLRTYIHYFGAPRKDRDPFESVPITHVALAPNDVAGARKRYPQLREAPRIASIWIRDGSIQIFSLVRPEYEPTDYERGMLSLHDENIQSAQFAFEKFLQVYPRNYSALWGRARTWNIQAYTDIIGPELERLSREFSERYYVRLLVGQEYAILGRMTRGEKFFRKAREEYSACAKLNPYIPLPQDAGPIK